MDELLHLRKETETILYFILFTGLKNSILITLSSYRAPEPSSMHWTRNLQYTAWLDTSFPLAQWLDHQFQSGTQTFLLPTLEATGNFWWCFHLISALAFWRYFELWNKSIGCNCFKIINRFEFKTPRRPSHSILILHTASELKCCQFNDTVKSISIFWTNQDTSPYLAKRSRRNFFYKLRLRFWGTGKLDTTWNENTEDQFTQCVAHLM